ncbi:FHA domain-containing protein [Micromonospora coriariae]|uniref:FHA domain-containing protein n=1 Tax=Micromonospora coriariae TaxID=285665 RepID=A0A1C4Y3B6_9ACTN|nr:FHA domain-containing protein [Micromonospora coriariae]SCF15198.1 FHA domain-containing protein [Micromonospora coriariae]
MPNPSALPPIGEVAEHLRDFTSELRNLHRQAGSPGLELLNLSLSDQKDPFATVVIDLASQAMRGQVLLPWPKVQTLVRRLAEWVGAPDPDEIVDRLHVKWTTADASQMLHRLPTKVQPVDGDPSSGGASPPCGFLEARRGGARGQIWELPDGPVMIGRSSTCFVTLPDSSVSREHAVISRTGINFTVRDLGSTNGTYLNAERLDHSVEYLLEHNDQLSVGVVLLTFLLDAAVYISKRRQP